MMTAYYCRGTKGDGSLCNALLFKGQLVDAVVQVTCKHGECGHHMNTIGFHPRLAKKKEAVLT